MDMNYDAIICGMSAWHYHATPPILRDTEIPAVRAQELAAAGSLRLPKEVLTPRKNARRVDALVSSRILTDLKGIPLPIHVMVDRRIRRRNSALVHLHVMGQHLRASDVLPLGNGLGVLTPQAALRLIAGTLGYAQTLMRAFEACGIYALEPDTQTLALAATQLEQSGVLSREAAQKMQPITAYWDSNGKRVAFTDASGNDLPWVPCYNSSGKRTKMWKRPPLLNSDDLREYMQSIWPLRHSRAEVTAKIVAEEVHDGAGSPLESQAAILMFSADRYGGAGWPWPKFNKTIPFAGGAVKLGNKKQAVGDMVLEDKKAIFEVNGKAFHADKHGFTVESGRRAALEHMGYKVFDISYEHLSDLEAFDALMKTFSEQLSIPAHVKDSAFLRRREKLHADLFPEQYR